MTEQPNMPSGDAGHDTGRPAAFFEPERYSWPPDPVLVWLFVICVFAFGGPLTWLAVRR
ncbi:hypothetical protein ACFSL4_15545 [Streptomyces caeni]|uniref:Uncharacterized protein n=1 Tax=Streptomyces caeni TaxID=2307231 RepID=A0ABW4IUF6_9ACTN